MSDRHDLNALADDLLAQASDSPHGRASLTVAHGDRQRAVLMAFSPGAELGEHEAPPAATLQVLRGQALLRAGDDEWDSHRPASSWSSRSRATASTSPTATPWCC